MEQQMPDATETQNEKPVAPAKPVSRGIYLLPNLFTTGAMFCGFYAILAGMDGRFSFAAALIFVAMILDGMDGRVARWTGTSSEFGVQYDSLSDLVSFGVAPSLLLYRFGLAGRYFWPNSLSMKPRTISMASFDRLVESVRI